ncbi:MAG: hypothetical protein HKP27_06180 [Myxococcales bacterium]|nr:hypothetical protein [Myxococcales bacterium]
MTFQSAITSELRIDGIADLSATHRAFRLQGPGAATWLRARGIDCPEALFAVRRNGEAEGSLLVARVGHGDVIIQERTGGGTLDRLEDALAPAVDVFRVPEESATFRLSGSNVDTVWRQTCAIPLMDRPDDVIVYTRVAGVSCAVIPERESAGRCYRIWVDYSYAPGLWQTLAEILAEVGGSSPRSVKAGSN